MAKRHLPADLGRLTAKQTARLEPDIGGSPFTFVTLAPTNKGATPGWHRTMTLDYDIVLGASWC